MSEPRKHHYLPQLYLRNFTLDGGVRDRLWVFDQEQVKQWPSTPEGAGHQRDFYEIEDPKEPMAVENWLAQFESAAAPVLKEIIESKNLPPHTSAAFGYFITFVALLVARVPHVRNTLSQFFDEVKRRQAFASKATGLEQRPFRDFDQTWHVETIMEIAETLRPSLWMRKWSVWIAQDDAPDLICSDNPINLTRTLPRQGIWPPGFGHRNTQVTFPLTRRMIVVGTFEGQIESCYLAASDVAAANSCTGRNAKRILSAEEEFTWQMKDGQIGTKSRLMKLLLNSTTRT